MPGPTVPRTSSTSFFCSSFTVSVVEIASTPLPTEEGVFGMQRTMG